MAIKSETSSEDALLEADNHAAELNIALASAIIGALTAGAREAATMKAVWSVRSPPIECLHR